MLFRASSLVVRVLMCLPCRFYFIESARVGQDYTSYVRIGTRPKVRT
jgi:hypothetical protein